MTDKIYSFIGLAVKAGKIASGEELCERAVKSEKAQLVIVAEDASNNTQKKFIDMCNYRGLELRVFGTKELLGRYTGKALRAVVAIVDQGFASNLIKMIDTRRIEDGGAIIGESKSL